MEVREINAKMKNTMPVKEKEELIKKRRAEDDKLRKGMFEFIDAQGGWLEFSHRTYPGESIKIIKLIHGEICELPMGIIRHLNNTKKKVRRYNLEISMSAGKTPRTYETISRVRFTPMDVL
jgi:hypothetical protein